MATVSRVTETLFDQIKSELEWIDPLTAAIKNQLSKKTVMMIKGSENFAEYEENKRAQHPKSNKLPLGERLDAIERKMDEILLLSRQNRLV